MKNRLLTLAGTLALLAVLGRFYARPVLAQVRAALVQSVDEPGRNPFALSASGVSSATFWTVPAGKRYVIETFTEKCDVDTGGSLTAAEVQVTTSGTLALASAPAFYRDYNFGSGGHFVNTWMAGGTTRLYADPGSDISMLAKSNFNASGAAVRGCEFSVSGHVINNP